MVSPYSPQPGEGSQRRLPPPVPFGPAPVFVPSVPATAPLNTPATAAATEQIARSTRVASIIAILGAAAVAAATFLPWFRQEVVGSGTRAGNGWTNVLGSTIWGPVLLGLAIVCAAAAAPAAARVRRVPSSLVAALGGIVVFLIALSQAVSIGGDQPGSTVVRAYGSIMLVVAGAVVAAATMLAAIGIRGARVSSSRAVGAVG